MHSQRFQKALKGAPQPSYVLDEGALIKNLELLDKVQKLSSCEILCAFKGYAMWSSFPLLKKHLSGATASSLHEVMLCNEEWGEKAHSCFVVYPENEFDDVLRGSSHLTFNSLNQYQQYKDKVLSTKEVQFALRLNPEHSMVEVDKYDPCAPGSRFGVKQKEIGQLLPEGISGIHIHGLCESSAEDLVELLEVAEEKYGHLFHQASWVNLGGGHHITKKGYDVDLLVETLRNFKNNYGVQVFLEPGEAVGWQTGVLKAKVEDVQENNAVKTAILNVSFCAHMPDCLEMPYKPTVQGEADEGLSYTLAGNTCMSGDFVEGFTFSAELKVGDDVIFEDMMHYTFVKNNTFNGVPLPSLCSVDIDGNLKLIRSFGYSDYKERLS